MEQVKKNFTLEKFLKWFFVASMAGFAVYLIVAIVLACLDANFEQPITHILTGSTLFSDFAETLSFAACPNPYDGSSGFHSIYPPLSFLIFYPFALICNAPLQQYIAGEITLAQLSANPLFIFSFLLFYVICLAIIMIVAAKFTKLKGINLFYLFGIIFVFGPLLFEFCRANNTLLVVIFGLLFFFLHSSEKRWQRELSYVCLAAAATMKIYPIFMIFYLIWKEKAGTNFGRF